MTALDRSLRPAIGYATYWLLRGKDASEVDGMLYHHKGYRSLTAAERATVLTWAETNATAVRRAAAKGSLKVGGSRG